MVSVVPMSLSDANEYVKRTHRHHKPLSFGLFAIGAARDEEIVGCVIVARPSARMNEDGWTCEVARLASDGTKNVCSMLYAAAWRAARAMGYRRLITYTLATEPGTSLRAAGMKEVGRAGGGPWHRESRPRVDRHPTQEKIRWEFVA